MITKLAILFSRMLNAVIGSRDINTMLCAWAWSEQERSAWAFTIVYFVDNCTPLRWWVTAKRRGIFTHCEDCFFLEWQRKKAIWELVEAERQRLIERAREL